MQQISSVLTLVVINALFSTCTAVAKPANPAFNFDAMGFDRSLKLASVAATIDRTTDHNSTYLFTMTLPERTGRQFSKLSVSLTAQNSNKTIAPMPFDLPSTKAFLGAPKEGGRALGVQDAWIDETGVLWVQFSAPVPPQTKLTLALKLRKLPSAARYDYGIAAYPESKAAAIFVGDGILTIKR